MQESSVSFPSELDDATEDFHVRVASGSIAAAESAAASSLLVSTRIKERLRKLV